MEKDQSAQQQMRQHMEMMHKMRQQKRWVHFANILLGCWLITCPFTLGYLDAGNFGPGAARVTVERMLAPPEQRMLAMFWSDIASGVLIAIFGAMALFERWRWAQWANVAVAFWLLAAPLIFWTPNTASYANDTLVAGFVIAFSILVPMMPGMSMESMMDRNDIPPGWDYSPSSWSQRLPIIALAFVGFFCARYLTAYQLGHIGTVWDPFFGDGTRRIITSSVSRAWPVPDAGLGAASYLLEALSGMMGGRQRWRTMPWMVAMFGVLVVPLGGVSIFFIMIQPVVIGTWCTVCLVSAAAMVLMLPYTFDELVAMFEFLQRARRAGKPLWPLFWHGGAEPDGRDDASPPLEINAGMARRLARQAAALPKAMLLSAALGIWLMFTRITLDAQGLLADSNHLTGATIFVISVCAFAEVARPMRWLNIPLALWLLLSPWVLPGATELGLWADMITAAALIALAPPRGPVRHRYAGWDRYLAW
jgi:Vitamin K epoxide reductase family